MVSIRSKGIIHQAHEDKLPMTRRVGKTTYRLYSTHKSKTEVREQEQHLYRIIKEFPIPRKLWIERVKIGNKIVYCLFMERI